MKLMVITIDTEADCSADWTGRNPESYDNVGQLRQRLLPVLSCENAIATLLLNGDVIERDEPSNICGVLQQNESWELGAHLHGEFVSPGRKFSSPAGILLNDFQSGYSAEMEFEKMQTLTRSFQERFGFAPTSFRAGRYGAGSRTLLYCLKLGYEVDTSIVPGAVFRENAVIVDYRQFASAPLVIADGEKRIVEIPITVRGFSSLPYLEQRQIIDMKRLNAKFHVSFASRVLFKLLRSQIPQPMWLRPSYCSSEQLTEILHWLEKNESSIVVANMMFHSNELVPGASPYNESEGDVAAFVDRIAVILKTAKHLGYKFVTLTQAGRIVKESIL
jgi:hypothetical protein